ncbi:hypothetical protein LKW31_14390 [Pantoea agglomerans]|uniref:hypothetical protein n=1 Tax=Enterobacter agglomerans TaxID=549 RepID=UPI001E53DC45|nr:hypothetical protein [Pantoea agglomerans]UEG73548.1 hypothetical protein LKW31_14390 [Pantoea agglomerans]
MINVLSRSAAVVLLFSNAMSSYAASVESEVSDTDTVVIGAISEKVTVRVMGYKNLNGSEKKYGDVYVSTSSTVGQLAVTFGPENEPTVTTYPNGPQHFYHKPTGTIKNAEGDKYQISMDYLFSGKTSINGTPWALVAPKFPTVFSALIPTEEKKLNPGVYPISVRAALYQQ